MATLSLCVTYSFRGAAPILFIALQDRASGQTMALLNVDSLAVQERSGASRRHQTKQNNATDRTPHPNMYLNVFITALENLSEEGPPASALSMMPECAWSGRKGRSALITLSSACPANRRTWCRPSCTRGCRARCWLYTGGARPSR